MKKKGLERIITVMLAASLTLTSVISTAPQVIVYAEEGAGEDEAAESEAAAKAAESEAAAKAAAESEAAAKAAESEAAAKAAAESEAAAKAAAESEAAAKAAAESEAAAKQEAQRMNEETKVQAAKPETVTENVVSDAAAATQLNSDGTGAGTGDSAGTDEGTGTGDGAGTDEGTGTGDGAGTDEGTGTGDGTGTDEGTGTGDGAGKEDDNNNAEKTQLSIELSEPITKTYDATKNAEVTINHVLAGEKEVPDDVINAIQVSAEYNSQNVADAKEVRVAYTWADGTEEDIKGAYILPEVSTISGSIEKKDIKITLPSAQILYGIYADYADWGIFKFNNIDGENDASEVIDVSGKKLQEAYINTQLAEGENTDNLNMDLSIVLSEEALKSAMENFGNTDSQPEVSFKLNAVSDLANYNITVTGGDVTVTGKKMTLEDLDITVSGGEPESEDYIYWVKEETDGKVLLAIQSKESLKEYSFTSLHVENTEANSQGKEAVLGESVDISELFVNDSDSITADVYLYNEKMKSDSVKISLRKDGTPPVLQSVKTKIENTDIEIADEIEQYLCIDENAPVIITLEETNLKEAAAEVNGEEVSSTCWENGICEIPAETFGADGSYTISITATDKAGNKLEEERTFTIDRTSPIVSVELDGEETTWTDEITENSKVYSKDESRTLTITVVEKNFDSSLVQVTVNGESAQVVWETGNEENTHIGTISFEDDMEYNVVVGQFKDKAGNPAYNPATEEAGETEFEGEEYTFILDHTSPEVVVDWDRQVTEGLDGKDYCNQDRTLTITVKDANFDKSLAPVVKVNGDSIYEKTNDEELDSEESLTISWTTGEDENTYIGTVNFEEDGDYNVIIGEFKDKAGNPGKYDGTADCYERTFTIDKTRPVVEITYKQVLSNGTEQIINPENAVKGSINVTGKVVVTVKVTEHNFNAEQVYFSGAGQEYALMTDTNSGEAVRIKPQSQTDNGDIHTITYEFTADANYETQIAYTDLAGNASAINTQTARFTVDNTQPGGSIKIKDSDGELGDWKDEFIDSPAFELPSNKAYLEVILTTEDNLTSAGDVQAAYYVSAAGMSTAQLDELAESKWSTWKNGASFRITEEQQAVVYARLTDKAGNVKYISTNGVILDRSMECPQIDIGINASAYGIYNKDVPLTVTVTDTVKNNSYSGLKSVSYSVKVDGKETDSFTWNAPAIGQLQYVMPASQTVISAAKHNSNNVTVTVSAEDYAGNVPYPYSRTIELKIDSTKPKIAVSVDGKPVNGKSFQSGRTAEVVYTERNFDRDLTEFVFNISGVGDKTCTANELVNGALEKFGITAKWGTDSQSGYSTAVYTDARENHLTVTFGSNYEAEYTIKSITCTDRAGNTSQPATYTGNVPTNFIVDKTKPDIESKIATAQSADGIYDGNVTVRVSLTDPIKNSSYSGLINVKYEVRNNKKVTQTGTLEISNRQKMTADIVVDSSKNNGNNVSVVITAQDSAGNERTVTVSDLAIDVTKPEITVSVDGIPVNSKYFQASRTATVTFTERNFKKENAIISVNISGVGVKQVNAAQLVNGALKTWGITAKWKSDSQSSKNLKDLTDDRKIVLEIVFGKDVKGKVYPAEYKRFTVTATDLAGNSNSAKYKGSAPQNFVIDNVKPQLKLNITTAKPQNKIYAGNVTVSVASNDPIKNSSYAGLKSVTYQVLNGKTVTQKGTLSIKDLQKMSGTIKVKSSKNNSNNITVKVTATDYAGNKLQQTKKIAIDVTAPTITVTYDNSQPSNGRYYQSRTATVTIRERNFDASRVTWSITNTDGTQPNIGGWSSSGTNGVSDGTTHTCTVTFSGDGDYTVGLSVTDMAGNSATYVRNANDEFTVDHTAPVINVAYVNGSEAVMPGASEATRIFLHGDVAMQVTINEHNFDAGSGLVWTVNGSSVAAGFSGGGDIHSASTIISEDGHYVTNISYTDLAGNTANAVVPAYFTLDNEGPSDGMVEIEPFGSWNSYTSFGNFINSNNLTAVITGTDELSGPPEIFYYKSADEMTEEELENVDWEAGDTLTLEEEQQFIVYAKLRDLAGNISYISSDGVILDRSIDKPLLTVTTEEPEDGIYNSDVDVDIFVNEPKVNDSYSGIRKVNWKVTCDGVRVQTGSYQMAEHTESDLHSIRILSEQCNSNNVLLTVDVEDNAGNKESAQLPLMIDVTDPEITVEYDGDITKTDGYYNMPRKAIVTVKERNFDENKVNLSITNTDGNDAQISEWTSSAESGIPDETTHTCEVEFIADGDYEFTLSAADLAGNRTEYGQTDTFTVDMTIPEIEVTFDNNNNYQNSNYYSADRRATITITEHNFDQTDVQFDFGSGKAMSVSEFEETGADTYTATVDFNKDGFYELQVSCTDLAGNASEEGKKNSFYIDKTKPEIAIAGVAEANKDEVKPVITIKDQNYTAQGVEISLKGLDQDPVTPNIETSDSQAGGAEIVLADMEHVKENDNLYTLEVTVLDRAGNKNTQQLQYSVNRFGSVYDFDEFTKNILDQYYTQMEPEGEENIVIYEYNVDPLVGEIQLSVNGELRTLEEGKEYKTSVDESQSPKVFTYEILRDNFLEEGLYTITIYSKDAAGNETSNQSKDKAVEFYVDNTQPTAIVTGITNNAIYNETSKNVTIDAKDNVSLNRLEIYVYTDDEENPIQENILEKEDLEENFGEVTITLKEASPYQHINIVAVDDAGNRLGYSYKDKDVAEDEEKIVYSVLVSTNLFIRIINNKPLMAGIVVALLVVIAGIFVLIRYRKKKAA